MRQVLTLSGKASTIFKLLAIKARMEPGKPIKELKGEKWN